MSNIDISNVGVKCPRCGINSVVPHEVPTGDHFFIGTCDAKTQTIHVDHGVMCDIFTCLNCGYSELKIPTK